MFIFILMLVVNSMQSLKYVFSLAMVMRNLAIGFGMNKTEKSLELVHTDLWGLSLVTSLGGSRYYITFIDDSSRKVWVYFLKNKSDVFETFKKWKA